MNFDKQVDDTYTYIYYSVTKQKLVELVGNKNASLLTGTVVALVYVSPAKQYSLHVTVSTHYD